MRKIYQLLLVGGMLLAMSHLGLYAQAPLNDDVCDAINLAAFDSLYVFDNFNSTVEPGEAGIAPTNNNGTTFFGWNENGVTSTVWFTFTAPGTGTVRIDLCNDSTQFDTQVAIYEVGNCSDFSTFRLKAANDDIPSTVPNTGGCPAPGNQWASIVDVPCLTPGTTYYVMVDGWFSAPTSADTVGPFGITIEEIVAPKIDSLQVSLVTQSPLCPGINDGFVATNLAGGYPLTTYDWNNGTSGTAITGLGAGTYFVTVDDGCSPAFTDTVTLTDPVSDTIMSMTIDSVELCRNDSLRLNDLASFTGGVPLLPNQILAVDLVAAGNFRLVNHNLRNRGPVSTESSLPDVFVQGDYAFGLYWTINTGSNELVAFDPATGSSSTITNMTFLPADDFYGGLTVDQSTNTVYVLTGGNGPLISKVYAADLQANPIAFNFVSDLDSALLMLAIDFDNNGNLYGLEFPGELLEIDPSDWSHTVIGPVGYNANFANVDIDFDPISNNLYLAARSDDFTGNQLRIADVNSGASFSLGNMLGSTTLTGFAIREPDSTQPQYSYTWSPPIGWTTTSTAADPISVTRVDRQYTLLAQDECGVNALANVFVDVKQIMSISTTVSGDDGINNGTANVTINQGAEPFDIQWSNGDTTASIVGLSAGEYTVTVSDQCGTTIIDTVSVIFTSLEDLVNAGITSAEFYPNPVTDDLNIDLQLAKVGNVFIELLDTRGTRVFERQLKKGDVFQSTVDMSKFASGMYMVRVTTEEGVVTRKVFRD
ncbi:MAG: T9SS type A sorting domain-containing protein [Bacteroidota bacterium]